MVGNHQAYRRVIVPVSDDMILIGDFMVTSVLVNTIQAFEW